MDKTVNAALVLTAYDKMTRVVNEAVNKSIRSLDTFKAKYAEIGRTSGTLNDFATGVMGSAVLAKPIAEFMKLDESVTNLKSSMMLAGGKMNPLFDDVVASAKRLGNFMPGNTVAMNTMMQTLMANGVGAKDILDGVGDATAQFAIAMSLPYEEAAEMAARLKKTTKVASKDMIEFMDVLARTKSQGVTTQEMTMAFGRSGSAIFGVNGIQDAKEMAAIFGVMIPQLQSGQMAGVGLRKIMSKVMNPDEMKANNAMLAGYGMNMTFTDNAGKFKGFSNMVVQLAQLNKLRPDDRVKILTEMFGERGAGAGALIAQMGVEGYNEALNKMFAKASMGDKVQMKLTSLGAKWRNAMGNMDNAMAALGDTVGPALKAAADTIAYLAGKWMKFMAAFPVAGKIIGGVAMGIGALAVMAGTAGLALGAVAKILSFSAGGFSMALRGVKALQFGFFALRYFTMTSLIPAIVSAATATWAFTVALLANPITWIVIGIVALAATVYLLIKNWSKVTAFFKATWATVKAAFLDAWVWVKNLFLNYTPYGLVIKHWSTISRSFVLIWERVKAPFVAIITWIKNLGSSFYQAGKNIVKSIWEGMKTMASKPIEAITGIVKKIRNFLPFSPAKEGPLKDIHRIRLIETIAESIRPSAMVRAINKTTQAARLAFNMTGSGGAGMTSNSSGGITLNYQPTITVTGGSATVKDDILAALRQNESELLRMIEGAMARKLRTQF